MFKIYLSCSLFRATFLKLNFDFSFFSLLFVPAQAITEKKKQTQRLFESINSFFFPNFMAPGRMRNIFAGYDQEQNKDHENGESCLVYLRYEFLV